MDASKRAPGYDLFKGIVAIVLLILSLVLMWIAPGAQTPSPASTSTALPTAGTLPSQPTVLPASPTSLLETASPIPSPTATNTAAPTAVPASSTSLPATIAPIPSRIPTDIASPSPTPISSPTATPLVEATATPNPQIPVTACNAATARSRLQVGANATILRRLNFRSSPGIRDNWLMTNIPGTQVVVMGGPECVPYWAGAYLWWQIRLPDGRVGWSAEGSLHGSFYFMEPR